MTVASPTKPKILRRSQAAELLGVHPNTLAGWVKRGILRGVKMPGGEIRFDADEVDALRDQIYAE